MSLPSIGLTKKPKQELWVLHRKPEIVGLGVAADWPNFIEMVQKMLLLFACFFGPVVTKSALLQIGRSLCFLPIDSMHVFIQTPEKGVRKEMHPHSFQAFRTPAISVCSTLKTSQFWSLKPSYFSGRQTILEPS